MSKTKLIAVYQPHQNIRQHLVKDDYPKAFEYTDKVYWLPTYLSREDSNLKILSPQELSKKLTVEVECLEWNDKLKQKLETHKANGDYIVFMGAGSIDGWARDWLKESGI